MIGGALLLDGIRSMLGHRAFGASPSALGDVAGDRGSPWSGTTGGGGAADSDLARDAGIDHLGDHASDARDQQTADQPADADDDNAFQPADGDNDDDFGGDGGDFSDDSSDV